MFGLYPKFKPRMAKLFGDAGAVILEGLKSYVQEVRKKEFPAPENYFVMKDKEYQELLQMLKG
jgi:ketopantoate hydroxymethyltransferase